jgi:uncharacterized Fe-S center protein
LAVKVDLSDREIINYLTNKIVDELVAKIEHEKGAKQ